MQVQHRVFIGQFMMVSILALLLVAPFALRAETMCTQEAKQCPDGSWVGRTGPNCEFVCGGNASGGSNTPPSGGNQGSIPPFTSAPAAPPSGTYTNYPGTEHPGSDGNTGTYTNYPGTEHPGTYTNYPGTEHPGTGGNTGTYTNYPGIEHPGTGAPSAGFWAGVYNYWVSPEVSGSAQNNSESAPPVSSFEGDPYMTGDEAPVFSVTAGQEIVLPPDDGFFEVVGSWINRLFFWFW